MASINQIIVALACLRYNERDDKNYNDYKGEYVLLVLHRYSEFPEDLLYRSISMNDELELYHLPYCM